MIQFGTLGAADITPQALIYPCINEPKANVAVVAARDQQLAKDFARFHHIVHVADDYAGVIHHDHCNVIYNPLPISHHKQWSIEALKAGKHVLCEKSMASNEEEAIAMADTARDTGLILMDAFHYRYHPLFHEAKTIYQSGKLGQIESIFAIFSIPNTPPETDIRMIYATAGGVTMDIGCYPISWIRHLTDIEPEVLKANAITGPKHVDLMLEAQFSLNGIEATVKGDMRPGGKFQAEIRVTGQHGTMIVRNPLAPHMGHLIETNIDGEREFTTVDRRTSYCYQLDAFLDAVETGAEPITSGADAVKQLRVIDRCYELAGLPIRGI